MLGVVPVDPNENVVTDGVLPAPPKVKEPLLAAVDPPKEKPADGKDAVPPNPDPNEGCVDCEDVALEAPKDCAKPNDGVLLEPNNGVLAEPYEALLPPNAGVLAAPNDTLLPPNDGALAEPNEELLPPNEGELLDPNVLPEPNEGVLPEPNGGVLPEPDAGVLPEPNEGVLPVVKEDVFEPNVTPGTNDGAVLELD